MADRKKFEEMLERLINEDKAGAEELFHEIVVEKSREIYEALLEDDLEDKDVDEASDEEVDESDDEEVDETSDEEVDESDDEDKKVDEDFNLDEFEVEADPMAMGGDPADNMMGDVEVDGGDMGMDDMGGDEEGGGIEDRVVDLEDALDELKAEFEKMMSGEEGEEGSDDMDMDDMGGDEEGSDDEEGEESDDEEKESYAFEAKKDKKDDKKKDMKKSAAEEMREYVEKVGGQTYNQFGKMGDNGANTKSIVANKNDMGGTASNLNQAGTEQGVEANKGQLKGNGVFKGSSPKEDNAGNVNVPGSKSATKMSGVAKGHGAEKKGSGDTAANKKSIIGGK